MLHPRTAKMIGKGEAVRFGVLAFFFQFTSGSLFNCNFDANTCGFIQKNDDQFDWIRRSGATASPITGPSSDHTSGTGHYMYIHAQTEPRGSKAVLEKTITATRKNCLEFYYHMFAESGRIGDLNVYVDNVREFHKSGTQGNQWIKGKVNFNSTGSHLVAFEATKQDDDIGDIAIDDIRVYSCYKPENTTLVLHTTRSNNVFITGETVNLTCQASANPSQCAMVFSLSGTPLNKPYQSSTCSANHVIASISGCGELKISCNVENEEGSATGNVVINLQEPPTVEIKAPELYQVNEGTQVGIYCLGRGCPNPTVTWTKIGVQSPIKTGTGFSVLKISSIAKGDSGKYQCKASNGAVGSPVSKTITVQVLYNPKNTVLLINKSSNTFLQGEAVNMTCKADADPSSCVVTIFQGFTPLFSKISHGCSVSHVIPSLKGCNKLTFRCSISNIIGVGETVNKDIFIQVPPTDMVIIPPKKMDILEGRRLQLTCNVMGCPSPLLTWSKRGIKNPLASGNESMLQHTFNSLTKEETGYYDCAADNGVGSPISKSLFVNVIYSPQQTQITTNKSSNIFLQGEAVNFTCQSIANPPQCAVTLQRGQQILDRQSVQTCSASHVISNIDGCNEETFTCYATNNIGQGSSVTKTIIVKVPVTIQLTPASGILTKTEGEPLTLGCYSFGCPTAEVTWSKKGIIAPLASGSGNATYTFNSLKKNNMGTYRCVADNEIVGRTANEAIYLDIMHKPENTEITTNKSDDVFLHGESVQLSCSSSANPSKCEIIFLEEEIELARISSGTCSATHTVKKVEGCNTKRFSCFATNKIGRGLTVYTNVTVQVPVSVTISPDKEVIVMEEGSSLNLNCTATGCPTPNITWRNSRIAAPYLTGIGHVLPHNFTNVRKEHRGDHQCIVDNGIMGSPVKKAVYVNVTYAPIITILPRQPVITLYENDRVDLTCKVDANPPAVITWTKDNDINIIARKETLKLTAVQSFTGRYTCTARNGVGVAKMVSFTVTVKACQNNACKYNTSCISQGTTYYCQCPKGLTGRLCGQNDPFKSKFTITLYVVNIAWTEEYKKTGSDAFKLVEAKICNEMQRLFADKLENCELISLRKGSVISETRLTFKEDKYGSEVLGLIKKETVNDTLGPLILDQSALLTRVEPYSAFCGEQPCKFEGTCSEDGQGYRCDCKLFRFGTQCEKGIGFIPGVAIIVAGGLILLAFIFVFAYCFRKSKKGKFAKGNVEEEAKMTPIKEKDLESPSENHPMSSYNNYVAIAQDEEEKEKIEKAEEKAEINAGEKVEIKEEQQVEKGAKAVGSDTSDDEATKF